MKYLKYILLFLSTVSIVVLSSCKKEEDDTTSIEKARKNKEKGEKYMRDIINEDGVYTDPSGLVFRVISTGDGIKPQANDTVVFHYDAYMISGKQFMSADIKDAMEDLQEGLHIGLRHMNEGSTYKLYVPYYLAYGATANTYKFGKDTAIKVEAYSALIYEVRLDSVISVE